MNIDVATTRLLRTLLIGGTIIIAMSAAAEVLKPLALAILLTFLLAPVVALLEKRGLHRAASVGAVLLVVVVVAAGTGYIVGHQFASLARDSPRYAEAVREKLKRLQPADDSAIDKMLDAAEKLGAPDEEAAVAVENPMPVRIVRQDNLWERMETFLGPVESVIAMAGVVLLLVIFLLLERDAIGDKVIQLVGRGQVGVTTKTLSQIGASLGSYLMTLALVNAGFGLTIGVGCWAIGLPSPALWGFLAALFRFIPYLGTVLSFALPFLISVAAFPGWTQPALVLALFAGAEVVVNAVEPLLYGKSTGISPIGLLVSALFWAWLWGPLGLLLANALTVCLAVAGRHIPGLGALGTLLNHEVTVGDDLRWYQRAISHDLDGALGLLDDSLKESSFEEVCDRIIIPTLARAEADRARGDVDGKDVAFLWRTIRDWLDDLTDRDDFVLTAVKPGAEASPVAAPPRTLVGVATGGGADALVLRMLNMLIQPTGSRIAILTAGGSSLRTTDKLAEMAPEMILISHVPPVGLARARYLTKRMRARYPDVPVSFGYWDRRADTTQVVDRLKPASASRVVVSLAAARAMIVDPGGPPVLDGKEPKPRAARTPEPAEV